MALPVPAEKRAWASDLDESGRIVGRYDTGRIGRVLSAPLVPILWWPYPYVEMAERAFIFEGGAVTELPILPGAVHATAHALNDHGQIVGSVSVPFDWEPSRADKARGRATSILPLAERPVLWERSEGTWHITELPAMEGMRQGRATAINNSGQVVGSVQLEDRRLAVLWQEGRATDLGSLGGTWSEVTAINDGGQIVGGSYVAEGWRTHAFLRESGRMIDLGVR